CPRGDVEMAVTFEPRLNYARATPQLSRRKSGVIATDEDDDVATVATAAPVPWTVTAGAATAQFTLREGETAWFVLRVDDDEVHPVEAYASQRKLDETARWWDAWVSRLTYAGPYRLEVQRSALALKLCCYDPSGAIVAAPTTSILETTDIWRRTHAITEGLWKVLRDLVEWTAGHWREPDWSIWEARQEPKHYVYSKVLAWVALDRGIRMATELGLPADVERWRAEAAALRAEVLTRGWDPARGTFVQAYDEPQLDAAVLVLPKVGFLPPADPKVRGTLEAIRRELASSC